MDWSMKKKKQNLSKRDKAFNKIGTISIKPGILMFLGKITQSVSSFPTSPDAIATATATRQKPLLYRYWVKKLLDHWVLLPVHKDSKEKYE